MRALRTRLRQAFRPSSDGDLGYVDGASYCSETWQGNACMRMLLLSPSLCGLLRLVVVQLDGVARPPVAPFAILAHTFGICGCKGYRDSTL